MKRPCGGKINQVTINFTSYKTYQIQICSASCKFEKYEVVKAVYYIDTEMHKTGETWNS